MQTEMKINVTLTDYQKARINEQIVGKANIMKACEYADISFQSFNRAMDGKPLKNDQRDLLLSFCDLVEGKTAA